MPNCSTPNGEVTADDGTVLPIAATFAGAPSLTVDAVIVLAAISRISLTTAMPTTT